MTETEWFASTEPGRMLDFLQVKASDRKLRLFASACCRRVWHQLDGDVLRPAVEVIERYAEGLATTDELNVVRRAAHAQGKKFEKLCAWRRNARGTSPEADFYQTESELAVLVENASKVDDYIGGLLIYSTLCKLRADVEIQSGQSQHDYEEWDRLCAADRAKLADLLRCMYSPFASLLNSHWLTTAVLSMARGIHADRAFEKLPALADALVEAGCNDKRILDHCRSEGPHIRGCWVVDSVIGRK